MVRFLKTMKPLILPSSAGQPPPHSGVLPTPQTPRRKIIIPSFLIVVNRLNPLVPANPAEEAVHYHSPGRGQTAREARRVMGEKSTPDDCDDVLGRSR